MINLYRRPGSVWLFCPLLLLFILLPSLPVLAQKSGKDLATDVARLNLGLHGYKIGHKLTAVQKKIAQSHLQQDAYAGTCKFADQDIVVVVDKKTDTVLAMYKRVVNADRKQVKKIVAALMDRFGPPTTMAHDKIVYWAYNRQGAVSEDDFEQAKESKQIAGLGIIATVKLNSEIEIISDTDKKNDTTSKTAATKQPATGTIYFIITSDPLVQAFLKGD